MREIKYIVIHCTGVTGTGVTDSSFDVSDWLKTIKL